MVFNACLLIITLASICITIINIVNLIVISKYKHAKFKDAYDKLNKIFLPVLFKKDYVEFKIIKKSYRKKSITIGILINNEAEYLADVLIGEPLYDENQINEVKRILSILNSVNLDIVLIGGKNNV